VLLALWIPHELRAEEPLVDLRQVKNRSVLMADVAGFLICVSMYLFLPVLVESSDPGGLGLRLRCSVVVAGFMLVPLSVGTFVSSRFLPAFSHASARAR